MLWLEWCRGGGIRFEGEYSTWEEAASNCAGYDDGNILDKVLDATLKVKRGEAAFERDSVLFDEIQYSWPVTSGLMWAAARNGGRLHVLDFGGSLGSSYFQHRQILSSLSDVCWCVIEQPHYVQAGRQHIQDDRIRFYESIDECLKENRPDVILLSSVLQYLERPMSILDSLSEIEASLLILDRTPVAERDGDKLVVQHVPANIYEASYPMWVISRNSLFKSLTGRWGIIAEALSPEGRIMLDYGEYFDFKYMLFESDNAQ